MKAIRKTDGKVIEVKEIYPIGDEYIPFVQYYEAEDGAICQDTELDFSVNETKESEGEVISGWVARNKDNSLYLFKAEPWYNSTRGYWDEPMLNIGCFSMPSELFPQITADNSPMEVEIIIKPKEISI